MKKGNTFGIDRYTCSSAIIIVRLRLTKGDIFESHYWFITILIHVNVSRRSTIETMKEGFVKSRDA